MAHDAGRALLGAYRPSERELDESDYWEKGREEMQRMVDEERNKRAVGNALLNAPSYRPQIATPEGMPRPSAYADLPVNNHLQVTDSPFWRALSDFHQHMMERRARQAASEGAAQAPQGGQ
jgi:hypothetical protein